MGSQAYATIQDFIQCWKSKPGFLHTAQSSLPPNKYSCSPSCLFIFNFILPQKPCNNFLLDQRVIPPLDNQPGAVSAPFPYLISPHPSTRASACSSAHALPSHAPEHSEGSLESTSASHTHSAHQAARHHLIPAPGLLLPCKPGLCPAG